MTYLYPIALYGIFALMAIAVHVNPDKERIEEDDNRN